MEEFASEYKASLEDLTFNSKPVINTLTILADENKKYASVVVKLIEGRIKQVQQNMKLPCLYLLDSIIKNLGGEYPIFFEGNLVETFVSVFQMADEKARRDMYKLRQTWKMVFPAEILRALDVKTKSFDPNWPILKASAKAAGDGASSGKAPAPGPAKTAVSASAAAATKVSAATVPVNVPSPATVGATTAQVTTVSSSSVPLAEAATPPSTPSSSIHINPRFLPPIRDVPGTTGSASGRNLQILQMKRAERQLLDGSGAAAANPGDPRLGRQQDHSQLSREQQAPAMGSQLVQDPRPGVQHSGMPSHSSAGHPSQQQPQGTHVLSGSEVVPVEAALMLGQTGSTMTSHMQPANSGPPGGDPSHSSMPPAVSDHLMGNFGGNVHNPSQPPYVNNNNGGSNAFAGAASAANGHMGMPPPMHLDDHHAQHQMSMQQGENMHPQHQGPPPMQQPPPHQSHHQQQQQQPPPHHHQHGQAHPDQYPGINAQHPPQQQQQVPPPMQQQPHQQSDYRGHNEPPPPAHHQPQQMQQQQQQHSDHRIPPDNHMNHPDFRPLPPHDDQRGGPPAFPNHPGFDHGFGNFERPPPPNNRGRFPGKKNKWSRNKKKNRERFTPYERDQDGYGGAQSGHGRNEVFANQHQDRDHGGSQPSRNPEPAPLDIHKLLNALAKKPAGKENDANLPKQVQPNVMQLPIIKLEDSEQLKRVYPAALDLLYTGRQCSNCGQRFTQERADEYQRHLDWHFHRNKQFKENKASSRPWLVPLDDWVTFVEGDTLEPKGRSAVFDAESSDEEVDADEVTSVPVENDSDAVCHVCREPLKPLEFWHDDEGEWHYRDTVRTSAGKLYHQGCYEDAVPDTPTPDVERKMDTADPLYGAVLSAEDLQDTAMAPAEASADLGLANIKAEECS
eukprot:scpid37369/ scgid13973/ Pre-mRNA cleavage complex 2 protein Pcf11; Pre-mRNA cleavage complex II protein Pcf11